MPSMSNASCRWLCTRLQYVQYVIHGYTAVFELSHWYILAKYLLVKYHCICLRVSMHFGWSLWLYVLLWWQLPGLVPYLLSQTIVTWRSGTPFYQHGLTSIPAWKSNHMPSEVWDGITYPFPNFNSATIEVWEWIGNFIPHFIMDVITSPCWD